MLLGIAGDINGVKLQFQSMETVVSPQWKYLKLRWSLGPSPEVGRGHTLFVDVDSLDFGVVLYYGCFFL